MKLRPPPSELDRLRPAAPEVYVPPVPLGLRRLRAQKRRTRRLTFWLAVSALALAAAVLVHLFLS